MATGGGGDDGEFGLQIAPLLDVLFVLLLFFMVSAGSQQREGELGIRLPGRGALPGTVETPVEIRVSPEGQVRYNGAAVDTPKNRELPQLVAKLKKVVDRFGDRQPIIITPSRQTRHERVIDVLNACGAAKVKNVAFGAPQN